MSMLVRCAEDNFTDTFDNICDIYGLEQSKLSEACDDYSTLNGKHFHLIESVDSETFDNVYVNKSWVKNRVDTIANQGTKRLMKG